MKIDITLYNNNILHLMTQKESLEKEEYEWNQEQNNADPRLENRRQTSNWRAVAEKGNKLILQINKADLDFEQQPISSADESKEPWTEQEELKMIIAHNKHKNKWAKVSAALKGRTNNTVKNKFYSIFRRIKGKIQKTDYTYESNLELLEIYYIISLIESYLNNPIQNPRIKGKRGKDFIYTLIHNVTKDMIMVYKEKIKKLAKDEGSIDDLFKRLAEEYKLTDTPPINLFPQALPTLPNITTGQNFNTISQIADPPKTILPSLSFQAINPSLNPPQRPLFNASIEDSKPKEILSTFKSTNKYENGDMFSGQWKPSEFDLPLYADLDFVPSVTLFSPPTLSAGPAAAAAEAFRTACFSDVPGDHCEFSTIAKQAKEELTRQINELNNFGNNVREGSKEQSLTYCGYQYRPFFHQ